MALVALLALTHVLLGRFCRIPAPHLARPERDVSTSGPGVRALGGSFVVERDGVFEVHLTGTPEQIGWAHSRLLYPQMVENEGILFQNLKKNVRSGLLRTLLLDLAELRYRNVANGMSRERRAEIAAGALGFAPDPYASWFPTYQRFVYLNALYDIALSFEHSPLIGCTTFAFSGASDEHGGSILARNFDFEVDPIFDRQKAVFFVRETGKIPFASVAWPGLIGVVSGMNAEGVAVVVHGGRAGTPRTQGEPVVHALRAVLSLAHDTPEALAELARRPPLVSHIVVLTDAAGHAVKVERVPGFPDHVEPLGDRAGVTNHFDGPFASDPKNLAVREHTSTLARKARADELVARAPTPMNVRAAVALLRDRKAVGDRQLPLGDRRAIDALIATHGVVMSTSDRWLWVSIAPHLLGGFVGFDVRRSLAADSPSTATAIELPKLPPDPLLHDEAARSVLEADPRSAAGEP
jgi:hypothetical protein